MSKFICEKFPVIVTWVYDNWSDPTYGFVRYVETQEEVDACVEIIKRRFPNRRTKLMIDHDEGIWIVDSLKHFANGMTVCPPDECDDYDCYEDSSDEDDKEMAPAVERLGYMRVKDKKKKRNN